MHLNFDASERQPVDAAADGVDLTDRPGRIRMRTLIGSGGSGTVFAADLFDPAGIRRVAVKVGHHHASLAHEARALRRFPHRNIVELVDDTEDSIVVELCDLGTVEHIIDQRPISEPEARMLITSIGDALRHIHAGGWIHGDVNPGNIGLRSAGPPALFDFGSARPADGEPLSEGTTEYCGDMAKATEKVDVRSLAATVLEAIGSDAAETSKLRERLVLLIGQADRGGPLTLDDLDDLVRQKPTVEPSPDTYISNKGASEIVCSSLRHGRGEPQPPRTREFGPRPGPSEPDPVHESAEDRQVPWARFALLAITVMALGLAAVVLRLADSEELVISEEDTSAPATSAELLSIDTLTAQETLEAAGARWSNDGVLSIDIDGEAATYAVGEPGDVAAVADWDCSGVDTLGVFRPSTGSWFMFDDWSPSARSSVRTIAEQAAEAGSELLIALDPSGCAEPFTFR